MSKCHEKTAPLRTFEESLTLRIGRPTTLRPFVCDGSPLTCEVFIVGVNPASEMDEDFWSFWRPGVGFDKSRWFEAYVAARARKPLRPGKTRRNRLSTTRRIMEQISEEASPVRILETNIYSVSSPDARSLAESDKSASTFDWLLSEIQPRLIVAHGRDAEAHLKARQAYPGTDMWFVPHFSRGWSQERARELGRDVKAACG